MNLIPKLLLEVKRPFGNRAKRHHLEGDAETFTLVLQSISNASLYLFDCSGYIIQVFHTRLFEKTTLAPQQ